MKVFQFFVLLTLSLTGEDRMGNLGCLEGCSDKQCFLDAIECDKKIESGAELTLPYNYYTYN